MENVFDDMSLQISATEPQETLKHRRSAFVFITAESDSSRFALEDLRKMDEVEEVYLSRGAYDLVAKVTGESFDHLREDVLKRIRNISGIKSTLTLTVV